MSLTTLFEKAYLHDGLLVLAAILMLVAAISDVKKLIISNRLCLLLVALFPFYVLSAPHEIAWQQHLLIAMAVLAIGFAMFAMNLLGGGDVKMLAAASLWAGPKMIATLLLFTSFAGGILALVFAVAALRRAHAIHRAQRFLPITILEETTGMRDAGFGNSETDRVPWHKTPVPYGVAIACGGVTALFMMAQAI